MISGHAEGQNVADFLIGVDQFLEFHGLLELHGIVFQGHGESVHGALHAVAVQEGSGIPGHLAPELTGRSVVIAVPRLGEADLMQLAADRVFSLQGGVGVDVAHLVPLVHGAIPIHDGGIVEHGDNLGVAEEHADQRVTADEVEGGFHAGGSAAHVDRVLAQVGVGVHGGLQSAQIGGQLIPAADDVRNFDSGIRGNLRVINDEVFGSDVLVHRDGIQAFAVGQVLAGGAGQLPDVLGHGFPQLGSPFLDQVLAVLVQVGEDAVGHVLVELVEPAAGEVHVVHFTGRDGGAHLIAGHVDDVDLHADLLAQDLVQLFQHHRVVLGRRAVALYPGQLHDVIRRGEGREAHHAQDHGQSENQRNQFLHTDSLL